jgi:hypothetical protein
MRARKLPLQDGGKGTGMISLKTFDSDRFSVSRHLISRDRDI